jgi:TPR repeat protein
VVKAFGIILGTLAFLPLAANAQDSGGPAVDADKAPLAVPVPAIGVDETVKSGDKPAATVTDADTLGEATAKPVPVDVDRTALEVDTAQTPDDLLDDDLATDMEGSGVEETSDSGVAAEPVGDAATQTGTGQMAVEASDAETPADPVASVVDMASDAASVKEPVKAPDMASTDGIPAATDRGAPDAQAERTSDGEAAAQAEPQDPSATDAAGATPDAASPDTSVPGDTVSTDTGDTSDPAPETGMAEPDPLALAAEACLEIAGPATAGVPVGAEDAASQRARLTEAAEVCALAATADDADPAVLFHAAAVAQAGGNARETFTLLTRAAEADFGPAEARLGDYFLFGVGPQGQNVTKAVGHFQRAAKLKDAAGMTTLALLYQVATGVPRDPARMVELLTEAADQDYHFAQYRLAQIYLSGDGFPGRADAGLGIPDAATAVQYFTRAADQGNLAAALELSTLYADPNSGLPDNPAEQIRLTRIVANTGHAPAVAQMGVFYETGRGVDYDPTVAAGLYVRALETGKLAFADLRAGAPGPWDRDTALAFQAVLKERGFYTGPLDGIVGGGTAAAAAKLAP